jgi:branched-chain amino acid transport system ATP-binding protein
MLEIKSLTKNFGGLCAVNNLDMTVEKGEFVGLIGPNGAGKSTVFNLVTGFIKPSKGKIIFEGHDITGRSPHAIAKYGIVRTFQANRIFADLTVLQDVLAACHLTNKTGLWEGIFRTSGARKKEQNTLDRAQEILRFTNLESMSQTFAHNLPHGYKRILGIAIALAAQPKLLILDEPLSGMNSKEVAEASSLMTRIWNGKTTILLIEHNMRAAMNLCKRVVVINFGKKMAEGLPDEIVRNQEVIKAYLGVNVNLA